MTTITSIRQSLLYIEAWHLQKQTTSEEIEKRINAKKQAAVDQTRCIRLER